MKFNHTSIFRELSHWIYCTDLRCCCLLYELYGFMTKNLVFLSVYSDKPHIRDVQESYTPLTQFMFVWSSFFVLLAELVLKAVRYADGLKPGFRFFPRADGGKPLRGWRHMSYPLSWAGGNHALLVPSPRENSHDHPVVLPHPIQTLWLRKITSRYCSYTVFTSEVMLATGQQSKFKIILRVSNSGFVLLL